MSERVIEIVAYIVNAMQSCLDDAIIGRFESLSKTLIEQGYTEHEISSAFSWLIEKLPSETDSNNQNEPVLPQPSDRSWHSFDKSMFTPSAYIFLIQLRELDIIGDIEIEQILEHSLRYGQKSVSISEIKALVSSLILTTDPLFDGSFFVFNKSYQAH